jgi:hypothetical protein
MEAKILIQCYTGTPSGIIGCGGMDWYQQHMETKSATSFGKITTVKRGTLLAQTLLA